MNRNKVVRLVVVIALSASAAALAAQNKADRGGENGKEDDD
jgi:hypothetical protein